MMNYDELWKSALGHIEVSISKANFSTWFNNTAVYNIDEKNCVYISVPNGFAKEWLENKYRSAIIEALRAFYPKTNSIHCTIHSTKTPIDSLHGTVPGNQPTAPIAAPASVAAPTVTAPKAPELNSRYTFSTFVVGENNELAKAACHAVCEDLGQVYNPLFIYGGVGLGKTHLLQAVGNAVLKKNPEKTVKYTTSELFTNKLIASIKNNTIDQFKNEYKGYDLLIIDDIQFLSGKEKTQQEFFHIFNTLYQHNKQIILSSDRPPKAIATLEKRLRSRFEGGMIVDVIRPDLETRMAILRRKAKEKEFPIDEEGITYIAENIRNNVRELEGALNRIIAICDLQQKEPTIKTIKYALAEIIDSGKKKGVHIKDVVREVSSFYDITDIELINKGRKKEIVRPRQIAMYLLRSELSISYPGIGDYFSGRDHTTALHSYEKIEKELQTNKKLAEDIELIKERIYMIQ